MQASFDLVLGHAFPFAEFKEPVLSILVCQQFFVKFLAAIWAGIMHKKLGSIYISFPSSPDVASKSCILRASGVVVGMMPVHPAGKMRWLEKREPKWLYMDPMGSVKSMIKCRNSEGKSLEMKLKSIDWMAGTQGGGTFILIAAREGFHASVNRYNLVGRGYSTIQILRLWRWVSAFFMEIHGTRFEPQMPISNK
jgi:hypothetical protein